eukprot:CAMPEP_0206254070 /NCGR_PEP_ID=MMETSP0047_2-20121206/23498_1 /ASSEMBLY_ACC=CAM_ASM_000192 /TAXON_ID=195065 /ORGANISM="Chroomonas mesostigmatica_cf, Strain CCMP1168" /LENGTH=90 /DNA_ID=CAMNT_0053680339 /DNA_START=117 /DNA_END=389 /DNA_ORIENTATION=+
MDVAHPPAHVYEVHREERPQRRLVGPAQHQLHQPPVLLTHVGILFCDKVGDLIEDGAGVHGEGGGVELEEVAKPRDGLLAHVGRVVRGLD